MTDSNNPQLLADILKEYFQNSNEPLAVNFRRHFNIEQVPLDQLSDSEIEAAVENGSLEDWIDNQDVMQMLHISPRTLQTIRSNGILPFSRIGNKLYYRRQDIQRLLTNNYTMIKIRDYGKRK
jgi:Helix-turn-helix domain